MPDTDTETTAGTAPLSRRAVVAGAGVVALGATLAVAGCGSGTGGTGTTGSTTTGGGAASAGAPAGTALGPTSAVPVGSAKIFDAQGVVVTQATAGSFACFSTVCPHQGCNVNQVSGTFIVCPCHGSAFALDGSVTRGPAQRGLQSRPVTVAADQLTLS